MTAANISRRRFLTTAAGLHLGLFASRHGGEMFVALLDDAGDPRNAFAQSAAGATLTAYVHIAPDGVTTIAAPVPDIGQGVRTALAMMVAEELEVPWTDVKVVQAPADGAFGRQMVAGSGTVRGYYQDMRRAGATARTMLVAAAAARWSVPVGECSAREGRVEHGASGRSLGFGELAEEAATRNVPGNVPLKARANFKIIGRDTARVDNQAVVTGRATYGIDARPSGLRFAVVARPSALGARLVAFDRDAALAVEGVEAVVENVGGGVAVVGATTWDALQGRTALNAQWDTSANADLDSAGISGRLRAAVEAPPTSPGAAAVVEATFELPYLAHATMEPMNCTVAFDGNRAEVWSSTQVPQSVQSTVARSLGIGQGAVKVNVMLAGGGFGRRTNTADAAEAAAVARAVGGAVQVVWTREDDLRHDAYRPASCHYMSGAVDGSGRAVEWKHRMAIASTARGQSDDLVDHAARMNAPTQGGVQPTYNIPGYGVERTHVPLPVPTMVWRSVEHSQVIFANECLVDMLAHAAEVSPVAFRLAHLNEPRLIPLLEEAAAALGFADEAEHGVGRGVACFAGYGSYVAQAAEVVVSPDGIVKVVRVFCAVDCGLAINPSSIRAQMEGCVADAVSTTLKSQITVASGAIEQRGFWAYDLARIGDMPRVEVSIAASDANPGGMGELGYPAVSPAICNAIFAATGRRVTRLPLKAADLAGWSDQAPAPTPQPTEPADPPRVDGRLFIPRAIRGNG